MRPQSGSRCGRGERGIRGRVFQKSLAGGKRSRSGRRRIVPRLRVKWLAVELRCGACVRCAVTMRFRGLPTGFEDARRRWNMLRRSSYGYPFGNDSCFPPNNAKDGERGCWLMSWRARMVGSWEVGVGVGVGSRPVERGRSVEDEVGQTRTSAQSADGMGEGRMGSRCYRGLSSTEGLGSLDSWTGRASQELESFNGAGWRWHGPGHFLARSVMRRQRVGRLKLAPQQKSTTPRTPLNNHCSLRHDRFHSERCVLGHGSGDMSIDKASCILWAIHRSSCTQAIICVPNYPTINLSM